MFQAYRLDPNLLFGKDLYASLLANSGSKEHLKILESLTPTMDTSLFTYEHWMILGNYVYANKKYENAAYFAQQAYLHNKKNVEPLLLKANVYFDLKKYQEVVAICTEAINICPFRYHIYKCLVDSLLQLNRLREAESIAQNALKQLNNSPQALCVSLSCSFCAVLLICLFQLLVTVWLKGQLASSKIVKKYLEKAVTKDKNGSTNALTTLVEFLQQESQYEQATQLLLKHIEHQPTSRHHQLLGDCYVNLQKDNEAFDHYMIALRLDPNNQRATEGLNNIGRTMAQSKQESYYSCGDISYGSQVSTCSDHEADPESDTDPWPAEDALVNFD